MFTGEDEMFALIDPNTSVSYISGWNNDKPIFTVIQNSARVCEVSATEFPIAPPLAWVPCADNVVADQFYYDTSTQQINPVPEPTPRS